MALLDLLGRRWVLRIIWEIHDDLLTFRELRAACSEMSPSVLSVRVRELREAQIVVLTEKGYALTGHGLQLLELLRPLHAWSNDWADALTSRRRRPSDTRARIPRTKK